MKITSVSVHKVTGENSRMKGIATVVLDDCFKIKGIRIIEKDDKLMLAMPSRKNKNNENEDVAHPLNAETREMFEEAVLNEDGVLVHDRWNWCIQCQNFQELDDTLCSAPMYCYGCTRVGILPRSLTPAQHRLAIQQKNLLELHADKID